MAKEIIINASVAEEVRIAIVENGRLVDLDIETQGRTKHKGNIYKGIVSNIEDSLDAAFIEFGEEKQGFLPLSEIRPELHPEDLKGQKNIKVSQILQRGQEIVIQVTKDEIGSKGAAVSTYLSLPGRYVVLMHSDDSGGGISRKIDSEAARQAARDILSRLNVPEGLAIIIRTAGMNGTRQDLFKDFRMLCETWQQISRGAALGRAPTLLYREPDIVVRTIRDYMAGDVVKIAIDDEEEYNDALRYFTENMPSLVQILERHRRKEPIFQAYGIEQAIEELYERQVKLPSGGYIVIDQTEALVAIDVNSGKSTKEEGHAATVYKTNLEATEEIARQLRLRDLGGIIVIDFIDMISIKHKRDVERRLKDNMRTDKARVKAGRISENGTLELTRQRLRQSHRLISHVLCSHCDGTGRVRDAEGLAVLALRRISGHLAKKRVPLAFLTVRLPVEVANRLNNQKRRDLLELGDAHQLELYVLGDNKLADSAIEFEEERRGQAGLHAASSHGKEFRSENKGRYSHQTSNNQQPQDKWTQPSQKPAPLLSIGPVPTLIEPEDASEEWLSNAVMEKADGEHYEDPLNEALFGSAPALSEADRVLAAAAPIENAPSEDQENLPIANDTENGEPTPEQKNLRRGRRRRHRRSRHEKKPAPVIQEEQQ